MSLVVRGEYIFLGEPEPGQEWKNAIASIYDKQLPETGNLSRLEMASYLKSLAITQQVQPPSNV